MIYEENVSADWIFNKEFPFDTIELNILRIEFEYDENDLNGNEEWGMRYEFTGSPINDEIGSDDI